MGEWSNVEKTSARTPKKVLVTESTEECRKTRKAGRGVRSGKAGFDAGSAWVAWPGGAPWAYGISSVLPATPVAMVKTIWAFDCAKPR